MINTTKILFLQDKIIINNLKHMRKVFLIFLIILSGFLSSCGYNTAKIKTKFNEVSQKNVCSLEKFILNNELFRRTELNIIKEEASQFKSILTINGVNRAYDFRNGNSNVIFTIYGKDQIVIDQITLEARILDVKDWDQTTYVSVNGILIETTTHYSTVSFLIPFTRDHLKKIGSADLVKFNIRNNDRLMKGKLSTSDINWFKQFEEKCLKSE